MPVDHHHPLVGEDEAVVPPVGDPPGDPAHDGEPEQHRDGGQRADVPPGEEAGEVAEHEGRRDADEDRGGEVDPVPLPLAPVALGGEEVAGDQRARLVLQRQDPAGAEPVVAGRVLPRRRFAADHPAETGGQGRREEAEPRTQLEELAGPVVDDRRQLLGPDPGARGVLVAQPGRPGHQLAAQPRRQVGHLVDDQPQHDRQDDFRGAHRWRCPPAGSAACRPKPGAGRGRGGGAAAGATACCRAASAPVGVRR